MGRGTDPDGYTLEFIEDSTITSPLPFGGRHRGQRNLTKSIAFYTSIFGMQMKGNAAVTDPNALTGTRWSSSTRAAKGPTSS